MKRFFSAYVDKKPPSNQQPNSFRFVHCTDERALAHLEEEARFENLDLSSPPENAASWESSSWRSKVPIAEMADESEAPAKARKAKPVLIPFGLARTGF